MHGMMRVKRHYTRADYVGDSKACRYCLPLVGMSMHGIIRDKRHYTGCILEVGEAEVVKVLLAAGGDVNARDDEGKTPLDYASLNDHSKAVQILIANGGISG